MTLTADDAALRQRRTDRLTRPVNRITAKMEATEAAHQRRMARLTEQRDLALLVANRNGVTYDELVDACGISDGALAQAIRRARVQAPKTLAARPAHRPADRVA